MDKLNVQQGKASSSSSSSSKQKQAKNKKKPVKVVYIANPVKVKTSASDFRALVQELTGQESNVGDASRYSEVDDGAGVVGQAGHDRDGAVQEVPRAVDPYVQAITSLDSTFEQFEPFDQAYSPCMIDNYNALTPSSGLLYDAHQKKP